MRKNIIIKSIIIGIVTIGAGLIIYAAIVAFKRKKQLV